MKLSVLLLVSALACQMVDAMPCLPTTTIDYLDYVFYDLVGAPEYYELECYEQRIRELAEGGIRQINLRCNCMGVALYPSKLLKRYGEDGRWHYSEAVGARRLIETLKHYDPVAETIRLGHKYGLQVWCWDNICDEIGVSRFQDEEIPAEFRELNRRRGGYPLADDFFLEHPECWACRKRLTDDDAGDHIQRSHASTVARLRLTSTIANRPAINFGKGELAIYVSDDNETWQRYEQEFLFRSGCTADGRNYLEFDGLKITKPFIKIAPVKPFSPSHPYSFVVRGQDYGEIFNERGERLAGTWGCRVPGVGANLPENAVKIASDYLEHSSLDLENVPEMAFDYRLRQLGCMVGNVAPNDIFIGMIEFCHPLAQERKLARFAELAAYPFDGYILTMSCHSSRSNPDTFSYNPAVRERIFDKTGKDILHDEVPLQMILDERRDGISEYLEGCKRAIGDRPLYLEGWGPDYGKAGMYQRENFGSLYPDYPRLIGNRTIDGVVMWHDFSGYFTSEVTGGRAIPLGLYVGLTDVKSMEQTIRKLNQMPLELIDFYESLLFAKHPDWLHQLGVLRK